MFEFTIMVKGRQEGKTTSLVNAIRWSKNAILLVHTRNEAVRIEGEYPWMVGRVFSYKEYEKKADYLQGKKVCIDNLDLFLNHAIRGNQVVATTATGRLIV